MKQIKVLHLLNSLNYGGAERFLLNLYQNIDREQFQFDIMVRSTSNPMAKEFEDLGAKIIIAPNFPKNIFEHYKFLRKFVIDNASTYKFIHVHANSLIYTLPLSLFKKYCGDTKIILHSHSSQSTNKLVTMIHDQNKKRVLKNVDVNIACAELAGQWMYGKEKFDIIYNGIDTEKFHFNLAARKKIRQELNITEDEILLGSVGRLVPVKNFQLLINIMHRLSEEDTSDKYKMIIVGTGELEEELKTLVASFNLEEQVIFTGQREDVAGILSAMDIYLQPSLFEGFPFSVIEAQVAGLPTMISDVITDEVKISDKLYFVDNQNVLDWCETIKQILKQKLNREDYSNIDSTKIDMKNISKKFESIYSS